MNHPFNLLQTSLEMLETKKAAGNAEVIKKIKREHREIFYIICIYSPCGFIYPLRLFVIIKMYDVVSYLKIYFVFCYLVVQKLG